MSNVKPSLQRSRTSTASSKIFASIDNVRGERGNPSRFTQFRFFEANTNIEMENYIRNSRSDMKCIARSYDNIRKLVIIIFFVADTRNYGSSKRPCIIIIFLSCFLVITT